MSAIIKEENWIGINEAAEFLGVKPANIGRKISETNALGQTTKYKYSFRGDLVEVINPDHTNTKNLYSSDLGSIYETNIYCDEKGPVKKETIDDFGRVTSVSEISVLESENTYNNQYNY